MQAKRLQGEMVININTKNDLDKFNNIKLDLDLYKLPGQERHRKIEPKYEQAKLVVKSISVSQLGKPKVKAGNKPELKLEAKAKDRPESKQESKPAIKSQTLPPVAEKPTVAVRVSSVVSKASLKPCLKSQ